MRRGRLVLLLLAVVATGCNQNPTGSTTAPSSADPALGCDGSPIVPGSTVTCEVPGWRDRAVDVTVPVGYDPDRSWPAVIAYHGGGGDREAAARTTCPGGDLDDPACLANAGAAAGVFVVMPDGTPNRPGGRFRTWNAGGSGDLDCVGGEACEQHSDDIAYTRDLLAMLNLSYRLESRVVVTGLSNGGAMSHRLGCQLSDQVRVVVAIAGANQRPGCSPNLPVTVVHVHGTDDSRWPYEGGRLSPVADRARVTGAEETIADWAETLDCGPAVESAIPDEADDGMTSTRFDHACAEGVTVTLIRIDGGGHTWPRGYQYLPEGRVGGITQDWSANDLILELAIGN